MCWNLILAGISIGVDLWVATYLPRKSADSQLFASEWWLKDPRFARTIVRPPSHAALEDAIAWSESTCFLNIIEA
jgi:hypothetical protein